MNKHFSKVDIDAANKHIRVYSLSLVIRERQIKTTLRYHLMSVRMVLIKESESTDAGEGVEKKKHCYTVGGIIN